MNRLIRCSLAVAGAAFIAGCGGGGPSRADAVGALTSTQVPARYAAFAAAAANLPLEVRAWCGSGDPAAVTAAVVDVRDHWLAQAPFWSGPVMERRSRFVIDPAVTPDAVDALRAGSQPVDPTSLRELAGTDQRGLGAIVLLVTAPPTDRSCDYAVGASELLATEAAAVASDWQTYGPSLADDDGVANMALRDIVSDALSAIRLVKDQPDAAGNAARVAGVRWAMLGDASTPGISTLLADDTVESLASELDANDVNAYERTIATGVVGELGITVNFSDADGDG